MKVKPFITDFGANVELKSSDGTVTKLPRYAVWNDSCRAGKAEVVECHEDLDYLKEKWGNLPVAVLKSVGFEEIEAEDGRDNDAFCLIVRRLQSVADTQRGITVTDNAVMLTLDAMRPGRHLSAQQPLYGRCHDDRTEGTVRPNRLAVHQADRPRVNP